jgi:EAL domain-containing protein (putative c-di-GMP-specific phosphodiesterase class I)
MLAPDVFLPLAEQTGLIVPLGQWVLRTACQQAAEWQQEGLGGQGGPLRIEINVSPRQLEDRELPCQVAKVIEATGLMPGTLSLELTETALFDESDAGHVALTRLVAAGASLILDDFGTGYSSLTHLARFPIEALKIDRSFTTGLDKDQRDTAIVSAVIALGAELGVNVIAEGVETSGQLATLRRMGCPAVQGFLLDRPRPQPIWEARVERVLSSSNPDLANQI